MADTLSFLMPLQGENPTKTFEFKDNKWVKTSDYPKGMENFKGFEFTVENLRDVYKILKENQAYNVFLIHGGFIPGTNLNNMVRRKRDDHEDGLPPTVQEGVVHVVCLDVDGFSKRFSSDEKCVKQFVYELPEQFHSADYICQFSASHGLTSKNLKCHLFFWFEEAIGLNDLRRWAQDYNEKKAWGDIIDWHIYSGNQPIYTQRRICKGAPDPIPENEFIKFMKRSGAVKGKLKIDKPPKSLPKKTSKTKFPPDKLQYDIEKGIQRVLSAENFHAELNSMALSLANKSVPLKVIKGMLKGAMKAAKDKCTTPEELKRWNDRFNDIDRTVDSAAQIVKKPTLEDLFEWIDGCLEDIDNCSEDNVYRKIRDNFARKGAHLSTSDMNLYVKRIAKKTGFKVQGMKSSIIYERKRIAEQTKQKKKQEKTLLRQTQGIAEIYVAPGRTVDAIEKCAKMLATSKNGPEVFSHSQNLVSVGVEAPTTIRQARNSAKMGEKYPKMQIIIPYSKPYHTLSVRLERDVVLINESGKEIDAPTKLLHSLGQGKHEVFRPLTGIVENPFIGHDWELVQKTGYDEKTGLFMASKQKFVFEKMSPKEGFSYLTKEVLAEFPFDSPLDEAVAVSALLTIAQRPVLAADASGMPGFGITSPIQASGKTTLAQMLSYAIFQRPIPARSFSRDPEEMEKRMVGILEEGHACVLLDNIKEDSEVNCPHLATAITSDIFAGRRLGVNKPVPVPSSAIWILTGNKLRFVGDMASRLWPIYLNPKLESPENRSFKRNNLEKWTIENRDKILSAVLSIVLAGKEKISMQHSSRFKLWNEFIRRPIFAVSGIDISEASASNRKTDSVYLTKKALVFELRKAFNSDSVTAKQVISKAFGNFDRPGGADSELAKLLKELIGSEKCQNSVSVSRCLFNLSDVIFDDYVLTFKKTNKKKFKVSRINR